MKMTSTNRAIIRSVSSAAFLLAIIFTSFTSLQADSYYRRGKIAFSTRNDARAMENFQKAVKYNPRNGNAYFYMGYIQERLKGREKVQAKALEYWDKSILYYRRAVTVRIDRSLRKKAYWKIIIYYKYHRDWNNLAIYARRFQRYERSSKITKLIELAAANMDPTTARVTRLVAQGEQKLRARKYPEAVVDFRQAVRLRPNHRSARWGLSQSLIKTKNYAGAVPHLAYLNRHNRVLWQYPYKLGICYYQTGKYDQALEYFARTRRVYKEQGKSFSYYINLREGFAYLESARYAKARLKFIEALKTRKNGRVLGGLALSELGVGKSPEAARQARRSLSLKAGQPEAMLTLGILAASKKKFSAAYGYLAKLYQGKMPQSRSTALYRLGKFYLGLAMAARKDWEPAVRILGQTPESIFTETMYPGSTHGQLTQDYNLKYGQALLMTGNYGKAINLLERLGEKAQPLFLIARAYGGFGRAEQAKIYLTRAGSLKPVIWKQAVSVPEFQELRKNDPKFAEFLKYQGVPPKPVIKKEPKPEPRPELKEEPGKAPVVRKKPGKTPEPSPVRTTPVEKK